MRSAILAITLAVVVLAPNGTSTTATFIDVFKGGSTGMLVGGWDGAKWVKDEAWHGRLRGGERFKFYGIKGPLGEMAVKKPVLSEASGSAWQLELPHPPSEAEDAMGLAAPWNGMPRKARAVGTGSAVYKSAVSAVLNREGLGSSPVNVTVVISVDLDGDGVDEALISATHPRLLDKSGESLVKANRSDYSFVMLRHMVGGEFVSTVLSGQFRPGADATPNIFEIGAPLDLNGDGKMEIVVRWQYYEGSGTDIYELKNGRPRKVLAASDGA